MRARLITAVFATIASLPLQGDLILRLEGDSALMRDHSPIRVDAQPVMEGGFGELVQFSCPVIGDCVVNLPAGPWVFSSGDSRYYIPPRGESIPAAPSAHVIPLRIYRSARLSGEIAQPVDVTRVSVTAVSTSGMKAQCSVAGKCFDCLLPEGIHDLRVQIPGHVSEYRWSVPVRPEAQNDLGRFEFKAGASLTGRLAVDRGVSLKTLAGIRVVLQPSKRGSSYTVKADERGWFQFVNVAPGDYELTAVAEGFFTEPQAVAVISDREADLRHPLLITRPAAIRVVVSPMLDPAGEPWRIQLRRQMTDRQRMSSPMEDRADDRGGWTRDNLIPGNYLLSVMDQRGSTWLSEEVVVAGAIDLSLSISPMNVTGELFIGGRRATGTVTFQSVTGQSIAMNAVDGTFAGQLAGPKDEPWSVAIESAHVKRQIRNVRLEMQPDGGAKAVLRLSGGAIAGQVITPSGSAVEHGWISVASHDGTESFLQIAIEDSGRFHIGGLPEGTYDIEAKALIGDRPAASEVVVVNVSEKERDDLILKVQPDRRIRGMVVSQNVPVVGAKVTISPADRRFMIAFRRVSDTHGRFETLLPNGTVDVDVEVTAPGFATRILHRRLDGDEVVVRLARSGGELEVVLPPFQHDDPRAVHPWVLHDGGICHIGTIAEVNWPDRRATVKSSLIDPGAYSVCLATVDQLPQLRSGIFSGARCVSGVVPPFGRLTLNAAD